MERDIEAFGRVDLKWAIRVLWERIDRRVVAENSIGAMGTTGVAAAEGVAIEERDRDC